MASVSSYGKALGALAKDAAVGSIKGIGGAMKVAALTEMPGLVGAYGFAKGLRADANKIQDASSGQDNSTATSNVISLEMVRQLKVMNANIALQTKLAQGQINLDAKTAQFSEETEREKALRDDALLNAIKDLKGSKGIFGGQAANDETGGGGFFKSLASNALGSIIGNAIGPLLTAFSKSFFSLLTRGLLLLFTPGGALFTAIAAGLYLAVKAFQNPEEARRRSAEVLTKKLAAEAGKPGPLSKSDLSQSEAKNLLADADARMAKAKTPQQKMMAERDLNAFGGRAEVLSIATTGQRTTPTATSGGSSSGPTQQPWQNLKWRVPLTKPFRVTSEYGDTKDRPAPHKGIDLSANMKSPVVAAAMGTVEKVSSDERSGNYVIIKHNQEFSSVYCHLFEVLVGVGTPLKIGDTFALSGSAGKYSTGPHLHFEIRLRGNSVDPRAYIDFGKTLSGYKGKDITPLGDHSTAASLIPKGTAGVPVSETASNKAVAGVKSPLSLMGHWEGGEWVVDDTSKRNASGTLIKPSAAPTTKIKPTVATNDAEANKKLASIKASNERMSRELRSGTLRAAQYIWKADNQILQDANKQFAVDFSKATNRALTTALKQALFPKGTGVSQASTMGQMYRGQQLGNILKVDSKVNKLFTDVLGKQYGPMFAPVFSNMAKSYLEVGARSAGRAIFGGLGGMDANASNILTGQVLGNFAAGNKKLAFEQLVYGATGQATGADTVFAKAGFQNPMQGIQFMADTLTAAISDPLNSFMDPSAKASTIFDPRLNGGRGGYVVNGADVYGGVQRDAFGRPMGGTAGAGIDTGGAYRGSSGQFNPNGPYGQYETGPMQGQTAGNALGQGIRIGPNGQLFVGGAQPVPASMGPGTANNPFGASTNSGIIGGLDEVKVMNGSLVTKTSYTEEEQKRIDDAFEEQRLLRVKENDEQEKRDINAQLLQQQNTATTAAGDQAIVSAVISSRSGSGTGINAPGGGSFFNPNTAFGQVGNLGLDLGKSFLTQKAVQALGIKNPYMAILASAAISKGISFVAGKAFDAFAGTETGAAIVSGAQALLPTWLGGTAAATAGKTAITTSSTGAAAETFLAANGAVPLATAPPVAGAVMPEFMAAIPEIAVFLAVAYVISEVFDSYTGGGYEPKPEVVRIMRVKGNNDISVKTFQRAPKDNPPEQWTTFADQLLNVGFNATKSAEVETKQPSPYNFIAVSIVSDDIKFHLVMEDSPSSPTEDLSLGAPSKDFAPGAAASKITKFIGAKFKAAYADKTASIDKAILALNKLTYAQVSSGLISSLKTGTNAIDTSIRAGVFGTAEQDKMMSDYTAHKLQMETSGDEYTSATPRMVWSQKEGKYVEAPFTMVDRQGTYDDGGTYTYKVKQYTPNVLMLDRNGNPIMDTDANGTLDMAEIPTTVNSSAASGSLTVTSAGATTTASGAGSTVVANSGNTTDNSVKQVTTIIQGAPQGDLLRTSTRQTG